MSTAYNSVNTLRVYDEGSFGFVGSETFYVATSTNGSSITPGVPVAVTLGSADVAVLATAKPVVGTDYIAGIAMSVSTETATATGTVQVAKVDTKVSFLVAPTVASSWNTQAKYDALVNSRVVLATSTGGYTIGSTDASGNGCVVLPLDVSKYPGQVRFAFRGATNFLA